MGNGKGGVEIVNYTVKDTRRINILNRIYMWNVQLNESLFQM